MALIRQLCPRCRRGGPFAGLLRLHKSCPECGLVFEREPGFWVGSLYINYMLGLAAVVPVGGVLLLLGLSWKIISVVALGELVLLSPLIIRYSRLIWMYMDQSIDPR